MPKIDTAQIDKMLEITYGAIGGSLTAHELLQEANMVVTQCDPENPKHYLWFVASKFTAYGKKLIYSGTDGQRASKLSLREYLLAEVKNKGAYAEVSGPLFYLMERAGVPKVKATEVSRILKKDVDVVSEFEYDRPIKGTTRRKVMFGYPLIQGGSDGRDAGSDCPQAA